MADLADKIDDLICTFDGTLNTTLDTLAMYMFGVFVFALLVFVLSYHLYGKYRKPKFTVSSSKQQNVNGVDAKTKDTPKSATTAAKSVPSTPPVRKRLGSKSGKIPSIATSKTKSTIFPPPATGPDAESVKWVNEFLFWLYSDLAAVNELANVWIQSLNDTMKPSVAEHGVGVELIRMLPETNPPSLNNIFCECASNDDIKITCDCEVTPAMQLKAFRQRGDKVEVSHYRVNVNKFRSRLNVYCITEKLHVKVKFDGWPEIKILLAQVGSLKNNNLDEQSLQEVIIEIVTAALRNTNVDFNLGGYPGCPRFTRRPVTPSHHLPLHYDSMLTSSNSNLSKSGDKLIVKVIKGMGLSSAGENNLEPFCVVEIDNPPQTSQTAVVHGTESPSWNEQFVFNVNVRTKEIMFEVYSKSQKENEKNKFLGLAIVSVQELLESSSQRQVISLQSRPYQNDKVSGSLTLEFTFLEGGETSYANGNARNDEKGYAGTPAKNRTITSKTVYANPLDRDYIANGVAEKAIKDLESQSRSTTGTSPNKSTLIIHSVQKQQQPSNTPQVNQSMTKRWHEVHFLEKDDAAGNFVDAGQNSRDQKENHHQDTPDSQQNGDDTGGRSRRRRRDFFGTIRKRLNRSRGRTKSVERNGYNGDVNKPDTTAGANSFNSPASRSASADRTRDHSAHSVHSTGYLKVGPLPREGSARSSLSEMSGVSGASSRTYLNEASTLVLETVENGIKKYYLVPLSLAQKNKWKKKGTKLHIYNEHTFVAKHLPGGTMCQICNRTLPRRLGKQGYECRDCQLKCHKQCHVRIDTNCPSSTVQNLELSGSLKISKLGASR